MFDFSLMKLKFSIHYSMKLLPKIENFKRLKISSFVQYCKSCSFKLLAWTDESDCATRKALEHFDNLNKLMLISLRGGQKQEYDKPITWKLWIGNWIVRMAILATFIRYNLFLYFDESVQLDLYLANPFPGSERQNNTFLLILGVITIVIFSLLREYYHYIERAGFLITFRIFCIIRNHGIYWKPLKFNVKSGQFFNKIVHLIMTQGARLMVFIWLYSVAFFSLLHLNYSAAYSTGVHIFFILCVIPSEIVTFALLINGLVSLGIYLWTFIALFNAKLEAIRDDIKICLRKCSLSPVELSQINEKVILFMNEIEETYRRLDYLHLYLVGLIAMQADFMLLLSLIFKLFPGFINTLATMGGIAAHFFLVIGNYWASSYHTKTLSMHGRYTGLIFYTKANCSARFKALEVQDRINARQTGIAIGNLCLITPSFSLLFILENINFIMLLTVNIRTLV
uniref:Odorant receptor n=1 Tax=Tetranychus urticae TaxID=32264 RepID=T1L2H9_TETUR